MKQEKFFEFWNAYAPQWLKAKSQDVKNGTPFGDLCEIKQNANLIVYLNYTKIKEIVKKCYFSNPAETHALNRYKRAAVLIQSVLVSQPLTNKTNLPDEWSKYLLTERFAYYMGISSILMDYDQTTIEVLGGNLFQYDLADKDLEDGNDAFLISVYKDLYFSIKNNNYNVLTMANVLGLIFSRISRMGNEGIKFIQNEKK